MWQQWENSLTQIWNWLWYEVDSHPFLFLGIAIIIISAWILYKSEVRSK